MSKRSQATAQGDANQVIADKYNGAHLYNGDCFKVMPTLETASVDMVFADIPYNITEADWDQAQFDLTAMWAQLHRLVKPKRAMVFTAQNPFMAQLVMSNISNFKSDWMWKKSRVSGALNAKKKPMRFFENVLVFAHGGMPDYYPIKIKRGKTWISKRRTNQNKQTQYDEVSGDKTNQYRAANDDWQYATTILTANFTGGSGAGAKYKEHGKHPTQKPVALMSYLIRTYSKPGAVVLDFTMGSGSTGVAAIETDRRFIGIEMDEQHYATATERISKAQSRAAEEIPGLRPQHQTELLSSGGG